nr:hypothetical protein [uncultured Tolumonas sp.]
MSDLDELIVDLQNSTSQLITYIDEQNIEPALELIERRLVILERLNQQANDHSEYKKQLQSMAVKLLPLEYEFIAKIEQQKILLAEQLSKLNRASKAKKLYRKAAKE